MPVPLFDFELLLGRGYRAHVHVWATRRDMRDGAGVRMDPRAWTLYGVTVPASTRSRNIADVHFARPALDDGTLVHELYHVACLYAGRIRSRHRTDHAAEEDTAKMIERSFLAIRSHIREELRLLA